MTLMSDIRSVFISFILRTSSSACDYSVLSHRNCRRAAENGLSSDRKRGDKPIGIEPAVRLYRSLPYSCVLRLLSLCRSDLSRWSSCANSLALIDFVSWLCFFAELDTQHILHFHFHGWLRKVLFLGYTPYYTVNIRHESRYQYFNNMFDWRSIFSLELHKSRQGYACIYNCNQWRGGHGGGHITSMQFHWWTYVLFWLNDNT